MTDEARFLLQRIAQKDQAALKSFYSLFEKRLFNFICSRLNDSVAATDIHNEVMFEVWRSAHRFEGRSSVSTWLFGIAHHKVIDYLRKNGRHQGDELQDEMVDEEYKDPEQCAIAAKQADRVHECVSQLSDKHRTIVHLTFFEEQTYREIAEALGCPEGTVKTRMYHAKRALMDCLASFV